MYKVALINITLNEPYWQYLQPMVDSAKKFFLKGHQVDYLTWSDMPADKVNGIKVIPTQPFKWPLPTLYRFHLFLREEELLKQYDYVFYCDTDMEFVAPVGDEILGQGLTAAQHPMYALSRTFIPPYEPNPDSASYIPRPGRIIEDHQGKRFEPLYFAGGFQGGRSDLWIEAMKEMKKITDEDFVRNYIPIWNDESVWNKYLFKTSPNGIIPKEMIVLNPSYIYPDSLNKLYYQRIWGRNYVPRLVTITKPFSLSKEGAAGAMQQINKM
jgi:hypothetical protein